MKRLALCCLFLEAPIRFRTTTVRYLLTIKSKGEDPLEYLDAIIISNLENLLLAVDFCSDHGIRAFRINSGLLPVYTHPECGYQIDDLPSSKSIRAAFEKVKSRAIANNIRLSFHPDQFVVLNSPKEDVVDRSIEELEYHGLMANLLGADVINIHGGGGYGDKVGALKRFAENFRRLSDRVQGLLTVENDDRVYTPEDLLPLCEKIKIPLVYDVHHHRCLPDNLNVAQATERALSTWNREPLFHISSPKEGWAEKNPRLHHDFIDINDVPIEWREIENLTIDIEAKAKEIAVMRLYDQLLKQGWNLA